MLALAIVLICAAILLGGFAWKFKLERGGTHFHRANSLAGLLAIVLAAASLWTFIAALSGNERRTAAQQPSSDISTAVVAPTQTVTAMATATVTATPTSTPTSTPAPTATKTKVVQRTRTVSPSAPMSTVVVNAPAANPQPAATTSHTRPKPKSTPTHSKPKPSPTKAKPKPASTRPTIVNVTTLASVNVHNDPDAPNSSANFCATANMPNHDQGVLIFTSEYGSFTEGMFSGSDIGQACTEYVAPSIVPPGGTDTVTVTLRDMNTGKSAVPNVQEIKIQYSVHP